MVSKAARKAIYDKLSAADTGLNSILATVCALDDYKIDPFTFDWTGPNFVFGWFSVDQVESQSAIQYPLAILYTQEAVNQNYSKFTLFDGDVRIAVEFYIAHRASSSVGAPPDFEDELDALEQAITQLFNSQGQRFDPPVIWNGELRFERGAIALNADGTLWRQMLRLVMNCRVQE